jgi:hypothetical protein
MPLTDLIILAAATLYVAYAIGWSHGPYEVFVRLRDRFPLGGATECTFCLSFWAALILWLVWQTPVQPLVYIFAAAGLATAVGSYTGIGEG